MKSLQRHSFIIYLPIEAVIPTYTFQNLSENIGVLNHFEGGILMSKKQLSGVLASVLLLGLTACNNQNAALNPRNNDNITNVANRDNNRNNLFNVNNNRDLDHRGPLTENNTNDFTKDFTNDWNKNNNNNTDSNISNFSTPMSSNEYPDTKAILIQDAKYQFLPVDPTQDTSFQAQLRERFQGTVPGLEQQPKQQPLAQVPAQPQRPNQAPTQQQQQLNQAPTQQPSAQAPAKSQKPTAPATNSQAVQQVIDLTNAERKKNGLPALTADAKLNSVAQTKSSDMQKNNYFSHTSPTYGSPFDMMRDQGVSYKSAGENIAQGQRTPQEVVQAWMNSEGHRRNILNSNYNHIGVGFDSTGYHWTQMFIEK